MENQLPINRVETDLNQWREREERFSRLFSSGLSSNRALLQEKLRYYDRIAAKYKGTKDPEERFALKVLRGERRGIEKQLYPGRLRRLLRRVFVVPVRKRMIRHTDAKNTARNSQSLQWQVQQAGFKGLSAQIDKALAEGRQRFLIPVSSYLNEKERMDHQLSFVRDPSGQYQFEGFKARLHNELKPEADKQHFFKMGSNTGASAQEAYNLLSGRAIQQAQGWRQLDFNDKGPDGNFRIKEFNPGYGYDLDKALQGLPLKELAIPGGKESLIAALSQGGCPAVTFISNGIQRRCLLEANPQFKSLNIYDEHARKISLSTALGTKAAKSAQKESQGQRESQGKRNSMRIMR